MKKHPLLVITIFLSLTALGCDFSPNQTIPGKVRQQGARELVPENIYELTFSVETDDPRQIAFSQIIQVPKSDSAIQAEREVSPSRCGTKGCLTKFTLIEEDSGKSTLQSFSVNTPIYFRLCKDAILFMFQNPSAPPQEEGYIAWRTSGDIFTKSGATTLGHSKEFCEN